MTKKYFKFYLTIDDKEIRTIPTYLMIEVFNVVWNWAKKYRNLQNGTDRPFTPEIMQEMIQGHDEIVNRYPYPFTENLLETFLKEFCARDSLAYQPLTEPTGTTAPDPTDCQAPNWDNGSLDAFH